MYHQRNSKIQVSKKSPKTKKMNTAGTIPSFHSPSRLATSLLPQMRYREMVDASNIILYNSKGMAYHPVRSRRARQFAKIVLDYMKSGDTKNADLLKEKLNKCIVRTNEKSVNIHNAKKIYRTFMSE